MFLISKDSIEISKTEKKGWAVFAAKLIPKGTIIGDYVGNLVPYEDVDFESEKRDMFLMYYNDTLGLLPDFKTPGVYLINHSCSPNCWIYKYKGHTLFFALRNISKNEELTISYLLSPQNNCKPCTHNCYCGSKNCIGTMHLSEEKYNRWQEFQKQEFTNTEIEGTISTRKLEPLENYPDKISSEIIDKIVRLEI